MLFFGAAVLAAHSSAVAAELSSTKWAWSHRGDVRAVVLVPQSLVGQELSTTIVWRRHDAQPDNKRVLVTDYNGAEINSMAPLITQHYGVITFIPPAQSTNHTYFVYWLPYTQTGIGAGMHFAWDKPGPETKTIATFKPKVGTGSAQYFKLDSPYKGSHFIWECKQTGSGFQVFLRELYFKTNNSGYINNTATKSNTLPIEAWSGQQSSKRPPPATDTGYAWMAMDGDNRAWW